MTRNEICLPVSGSWRDVLGMALPLSDPESECDARSGIDDRENSSVKESPVMGAPENASLSCVRKPSLEVPNELDDADPRFEKLDPSDMTEPVEGVG